MMKKDCLYVLILSGVCVSNALAAQQVNNQGCTQDAPAFTAKIGTQLINDWGRMAFNDSPYGGEGYANADIGAANFTGAQYSANAVLLPTVSPVTRQGPQQIYDYFTNFLSHGPHMVNNPNEPQDAGPFVTLAGCGYGVISGYYNFSYQDGTPATKARYTFQFYYQAVESQVAIKIMDEYHADNILIIPQKPGWYIALQNSAMLPASRALPANLLIR